jgi:hypothetical protein
MFYIFIAKLALSHICAKSTGKGKVVIMHDLFSFLNGHEPSANHQDLYSNEHHSGLFGEFMYHHNPDNPYDSGIAHHSDPYSNNHVIHEQVVGTSEHHNQIIGNPDAEISHTHMQEGINSCAVASQKGVIESITGKQVPEIELSYDAYRHGWYDPGSGTKPENIGKLLEEYGIPVHRGFDNSITDIATALSHGEKVIVGLNANEIWHPQSDAAGNPIEQPNEGHAVWVTGIYQDDTGWHVVMNDTGIKNGAGETVDAKDFINAWSDYGNFAVITKTHDHGVSSDSAIDAGTGSHVTFGGYYNADGTYHYTSDNTNRDSKGNIIYYG